MFRYFADDNKGLTIMKGNPHKIDFEGLVRATEQVDDALRKQAVSFVDRTLVIRNWIIGRNIIEFEQHGQDRAAYGAMLLEKLSKALSMRGRRGFSHRSLDLCRKFYACYREISQTVSAKSQDTQIASPSMAVMSEQSISQALSAKLAKRFPLKWSNYVFLLQVENQAERSFYEVESLKQNWSTRELKRQFNSSLYERLALSRNKKRVTELSKKGHIVISPEDSIKDPYVLEFLGLKEDASYSESDLESAIIDKLEHFLLELGKGFLFEARQKRITFDEEHFFVDLVFYNRLLRSYVLVDLKIGKLIHQDIGQMQMYVNYFDRRVKTAEENPTIGILLCRTKNDALVEMTLPKGTRTIFASRYQLYLPSKEELRRQIKAVPNDLKKEGDSNA